MFSSFWYCFGFRQFHIHGQRHGDLMRFAWAKSNPLSTAESRFNISMSSWTPLLVALASLDMSNRSLARMALATSMYRNPNGGRIMAIKCLVESRFDVRLIMMTLPRASDNVTQLPLQVLDKTGNFLVLCCRWCLLRIWTVWCQDLQSMYWRKAAKNSSGQVLLY